MYRVIKAYYKPFLLIFGIFLIAFFTIYRDQYFFIDDVPRSAVGYDYSEDFNRFSTNLIVHLSQMQFGALVSIAPFGQIFGFAILAIVCLMLVYLFTGKKPSLKQPIPLIFSTFLVLTPFMLNAWQYQFDTIWYAAAIFMAVLPFLLFWGKTPSLKLVFSNSGKPTPHLHLDENLVRFVKILAITVLCNIFVWTSWQIAAGIPLSIGLALIFKSLIEKEKLPWTDIITFVLAYLIATIFAYITILNMSSSYVNTSAFPLGELIPGILRNIGYIFTLITTSFNLTWLIFGSLAILGLFILNRFRTSALALLYFAITLIISVGPCLALQTFHVNGRSLVGPVITFTIFLLMLSAPKLSKIQLKLKPFLLAPAFILLYTFIVCAWSYGNALTDQYRYEETRVGMLMQDLAKLYPTESLESYVYSFDGFGGLSPLMVNHFKHYPVASYTFFKTMSSFYHYNYGYQHFELYYGRNQKNSLKLPGTDKEDILTCAQFRDSGKLTEVYKNYFYTISDTRGNPSTLFPLDPIEHLHITKNLTSEEIEENNLKTKDFGVCIELNPDAKNYNEDEVRIYHGHLAKDSFLFE